MEKSNPSRQEIVGDQLTENTAILNQIGFGGAWKLTLQELKPEFVGLLLEPMSFLVAHSDEYVFQLAGTRNFWAGIADAWMINPLYTETEVRRVMDNVLIPTGADDKSGGELV